MYQREKAESYVPFMANSLSCFLYLSTYMEQFMLTDTDILNFKKKLHLLDSHNPAEVKWCEGPETAFRLTLPVRLIHLLPEYPTPAATKNALVGSLFVSLSVGLTTLLTTLWQCGLVPRIRDPELASVHCEERRGCTLAPWCHSFLRRVPSIHSYASEQEVVVWLSLCWRVTKKRANTCLSVSQKETKLASEP